MLISGKIKKWRKSSCNQCSEMTLMGRFLFETSHSPVTASRSPVKQTWLTLVYCKKLQANDNTNKMARNSNMFPVSTFDLGITRTSSSCREYHKHILYQVWWNSVCLCPTNLCSYNISMIACLAVLYEQRFVRPCRNELRSPLCQNLWYIQRLYITLKRSNC